MTEIDSSLGVETLLPVNSRLTDQSLKRKPETKKLSAKISQLSIYWT